MPLVGQVGGRDIFSNVGEAALCSLIKAAVQEPYVFLNAAYIAIMV